MSKKKYIISNEKLNDVILNFIYDEFDSDNLTWEYDIDYDSEVRDKNLVLFYGIKFREEEQDDYTFRYIRKEYYESLMDIEEFRKKWIHKAPLLDFLDTELQSKFTSLFGNYWKPVFEKWFRAVYPEFPVKTFIYNKD